MSPLKAWGGDPKPSASDPVPLLREDVEDVLRRHFTKPGPYQHVFRVDPRRYTRRERVMMWLRGRWWALHDRLYPDCHAWDDE